MSKLTVNEALSGYTHKLAFDYIDLQTSGWLSTIGAANQRIIDYIEPGAIITRVTLYQVTDPAGASDLTIDVGTTNSDPDEYIDNGDVDGATKVLWNTGDALTSNTLNGVANNTTSSVALYMEFNGTHSSLTAGAWVLAWHKAVCPTS
jgi:hypothetical protein